MGEMDFSGGDIAAAVDAASGDSPSPTTPTETTTPASASTPTTAASGDGTNASVAAQEPTGPIPFDRHKAILEGTRKEYDDQYGWVKQGNVTREQYERMLHWQQRAAQDPVAFTEQLIREMNAHPVYKQQLASLAGKALAARRGQAEMPAPDVQVMDQAGNVVSTTYSAGQLAKRDAWLTNQILKQVEEKLSPVVTTTQQITQERESAAQAARTEAWSTGFVDELASYPHFDQNKQAIGEEVVRMLQSYPANDPRTDDPAFLEGLTLRAYQKIVGANRDSQTRQAVLGDLKHKAAASTANPQTSSTSAPKDIKDMTWKEAMEYKFAQMQGGTK